jgi:putative membrane protein
MMKQILCLLVGAALAAGCASNRDQGGSFSEAHSHAGLMGSCPICGTAAGGSDLAGLEGTESKGAGARALTGAAETGARPPAPVVSVDSFLRDAAQMGLAEVEFGEFLEQNADSQSLRDYGRMLVAHHTEANDQLANLAEQKGIALPEAPTPDQQRKLERLEKLDGAKLDRAAQRQAVESHVKSIQKFRLAANQARDPEVRAFAREQLPMLEDHLRVARQLAPLPGAVGGSIDDDIDYE